MHGLMSLVARLVKQGLVLCIGLATVSPIWAVDVGQRFPSVEAFVKSLPQGEVKVEKGYGDLTGAGRRDWAGAVSMQDPKIGSARQIVVLTQQADGSYQVAAQGPVESTEGGTGHHSLDKVDLKQGSMFVSWSWNWHGCGGGSTQQIKFYKNQWRVIGAEFNQSTSTETPNGYGVGDSATMSRNLLTGALVIHFQPLNRKAVTKRSKLKPSTDLLDGTFGEGTGAVEEFSNYAGC